MGFEEESHGHVERSDGGVFGTVVLDVLDHGRYVFSAVEAYAETRLVMDGGKWVGDVVAEGLAFLENLFNTSEQALMLSENLRTRGAWFPNKFVRPY